MGKLYQRLTIQPKENLLGTKAIITIKNYLGGYYYFTSDEVEIKKNNIFLVEAKHSRDKQLPSLEDIKDGLLKMILFTNLEDVKVDGKNYNSKAALKLTTKKLNAQKLTLSQRKVVARLQKEAGTNNFEII